MGLLICPVCKKPLIKKEKCYACESGHSYDISSEGYIHLLMSNKMNSKLPGDNKQMISSRYAFLKKEYYQPLADKLSALLHEGFASANNSRPVIVDAGCGEGYYTEKVFDYLTQNGLSPAVVGLDISKAGVRLAAKRKKNITFAVASVFDMPVLTGCADSVISLFAPICAEEFARVLNNKGTLYVVAPGKKHLFGLKQVLYDNPYLNDEKPPEISGFSLTESINVSYSINIDSNEDILAVFMMTPYYYKTPKQASDKLNELSELKTDIEFIIYTYKKII